MCSLIYIYITSQLYHITVCLCVLHLACNMTGLKSTSNTEFGAFYHQQLHVVFAHAVPNVGEDSLPTAHDALEYSTVHKLHVAVVAALSHGGRKLLPAVQALVKKVVSCPGCLIQLPLVICFSPVLMTFQPSSTCHRPSPSQLCKQNTSTVNQGTNQKNIVFIFFIYNKNIKHITND